MSQPDSGPRLVKAVSHAVAILDCFLGGQRTLALGEISSVLGLNKSSVYRLLETLVSGGLLTKDPFTRGYTLGIKVVRLADRMGIQFALADTAMPLLQRLRDESGETAALHIRIGGERLCVGQLASPQPVRMMLEMNHPYPLVRGAAGKAFVAHLPEAYVRELLAALPADEGQALQRSLPDIRREGFAVSRGEIFAESASICAPVLSRAGEPLAALGVHGPAYRIADDAVPRLGQYVQAAAAALSRLLQT